VSTLTDYERFCRCLLNKGELDGVRILSEHAVNLMTTNQLPNNGTVFILHANKLKLRINKLTHSHIIFYH